MKLSTLAQSALIQFVKQDDRYVTRNNCPQWIVDLCFAARDGMFPDDYKYEYIIDALELIASQDNDACIEDLLAEIEADCYNHQLLKWLASSNSRVEYVDRYFDEFVGEREDLIKQISLGQWLEKTEVANIVLQTLRDIID